MRKISVEFFWAKEGKDSLILTNSTTPSRYRTVLSKIVKIKDIWYVRFVECDPILYQKDASFPNELRATLYVEDKLIESGLHITRTIDTADLLTDVNTRIDDIEKRLDLLINKLKEETFPRPDRFHPRF